MSVGCDPELPGFAETRWVVSEDINIEHLLNVFVSIEMSAPEAWDACVCFMEHLCWQKPRQTTLRLKIEDLPDGNPSKAPCLFTLSRLFESVGKYPEQKQLLVRALTLWREDGNDLWVAMTLRFISRVNRTLGLFREGIQEVEEALEIYKRLGDATEQACCLEELASLSLAYNQLNAAEATALHEVDLLSREGQEFQLSRSHRLLGIISRSKGEKEKAIHHWKTALTIASHSNWPHELFWTHYAMAKLFRDEHEFNEATAHTNQAKSHAADDEYNLGHGMGMQAHIWYLQGRLEDARSEALCALKILEKLGALNEVERHKELLQWIEGAMASGISGEFNPGGESSNHGAASCPINSVPA